MPSLILNYLRGLGSTFTNNKEGKIPSKILAFVTTTTHNCNSFHYKVSKIDAILSIFNNNNNNNKLLVYIKILS